MSETNIPSVDDRMKSLLAQLEACDAWRWTSEQDLRKDSHAALVEIAQILSETRREVAFKASIARELKGEVQRHGKRLTDLTDLVCPNRDDLPSRTWSRTDPPGSMPDPVDRIAELEALLENERTANDEARRVVEPQAAAIRELHRQLAECRKAMIPPEDPGCYAMLVVNEACNVDAIAAQSYKVICVGDVITKNAFGRTGDRLVRIGRTEYDSLTARAERAEVELKIRSEQLEAAGRAAAAATTRAEVAEAAVEGLGRESELLIQARSEQRDELANWHRRLSVAVGLDSGTDQSKPVGWEDLIDEAAADHKQAKALKTKPFEVLHGLGYRAPGHGSVTIVAHPKPHGIVELTADERDALEIPAPAPGRQWWRRGDEIYYGDDLRPDFFPEDNGSVLVRATEIIHRQRGSLAMFAALEAAIRKALPAR